MRQVLAKSILFAIPATAIMFSAAVAETPATSPNHVSGGAASGESQPAPKQVQILDTKENFEVSGNKGQLARLLNPQTGIRETAVVMETTDLENKPIMIAMRLEHPLGEAELAHFDKNKPANVALSAKCAEVLVAQMPGGRHIAQGNQCNVVGFD
ncbi:hypothetical protein [uncultured Thalassospira sp.]|jgi:hypothetical protein|uniref:hypothetical protein n=1 Tax=uncultured Thalassospira sp. TaxID=404382 RepID=UPI0030D893AA|tara:strand:- start:2502 stop:2966 length:465 start_codon:yes stop_codon:yes gene_type:complete